MDSSKHTPMKQKGATVRFFGGGFDVRNCPEPEALAALIVRAANSHDVLVSTLRKSLQFVEVARDWRLYEVEIDGAMVDSLDFKKELQAVLTAAGAA